MQMKRIAGRVIIIISTLLCGEYSFSQELFRYEVSRMPFSSAVFNDISPVMYNDGVIFCSDRRVSSISDRTSFDGRRLFNIFFAERMDTSDWNKPAEMKTPRSAMFNNGPLCVAPDGNTVYFTSEIETGPEVKNRDFVNHSGIFRATLSGQELVNVEPFRYNSMEYDIAQPSVSSDSRYLFFSSDMPGGQGGSDIYYCEWIDDDWGPPVNLGPGINTPASENYPVISPSGYLCFTSDRPGGMGGMDIYYSFLNYGSWSKPLLLPAPVNSTSDDFAVVSGDNLKNGFFTSNRRRNDDIYSFRANLIRKASCETMLENNFCYEFMEENAIKYDSLPFRFEWRFGDGTSDTGKVVTHCYTSPGTYIIQLNSINLVTNEIQYNQKSDTLVLTEFEQAFFTAPDTAFSGTGISFSALKTNLPDWDIAEYYWNFGDETVAAGTEVKKSYPGPGTYNVQLILTSATRPGGTARETCVSKNITILQSP